MTILYRIEFKQRMSQTWATYIARSTQVNMPQWLTFCQRDYPDCEYRVIKITEELVDL